jgi:hypothetical protein
LEAEQLTDLSPAASCSLAKAKRGDYFVHDGVSYHCDSILGQLVSQLCLPMQRRTQVLRLAHNVYGGHMSYRKSHDRIRYSF